MGMISGLFNLLFGGGRNVIRETAEVFRENSEASGQRAFELQGETLRQFAQEFAFERRGGFDRFMDGLNRLPRPLMVIGVIGLFVMAMKDPVWFAQRMQGLALVPDPLWWLMGAIVSFYFGARHQAYGQDFQRSIAQTMARVPQVVANTESLQNLRETPPDAPSAPTEPAMPSQNPALVAWRDARN
ncbi:holin family protein [Cochlodiniinecator piscidefendens]|uniref:holin family protein n=1 Tax=Cochlodiniinecator piscidefendens TaxID=2715756 RepID=UPI00140E8881|nr:holin family protein [Cochlodiniinecator piscidefendens]